MVQPEVMASLPSAFSSATANDTARFQLDGGAVAVCTVGVGERQVLPTEKAGRMSDAVLAAELDKPRSCWLS